MPNRVTLVVLYEDEMHDAFVNAFLNRMKMPLVGRSRLHRKQTKAGVLEAFPAEVRALRKGHVQCRLVVLIDGDELSDAQIIDRLQQKLRAAGLDEDFKEDAVLIVRPRWELENWVLHILGESIGEDREPNARRRVVNRGREAARILAEACKVKELQGEPLPSLAAACEDWMAHRARWNY